MSKQCLDWTWKESAWKDRFKILHDALQKCKCACLYFFFSW